MATDAEEIRTQTSPCPIPDNSFSTLSIKITRKNQDRHWKLRFIYLQCCEYRHTLRRLEPNTGTGHTSPALLIYLFVELLQKCQVVQLESLKTGVAECIVMDQVRVENPVPTEDEDEDDESENAEENAALPQFLQSATHLYVLLGSCVRVDHSKRRCVELESCTRMQAKWKTKYCTLKTIWESASLVIITVLLSHSFRFSILVCVQEHKRIYVRWVKARLLSRNAISRTAINRLLQVSAQKLSSQSRCCRIVGVLEINPAEI
ncbi:hypothetical protein D9C73_008240 [Collichthys lucidus]|uniref:Uncharacterized protein n=1 Tax=Collichthys lucidus TaxID=240159 RepID=A0A4U5UHV7_COLLU|nr:hypothetical protein D9C73_008240 [Collichthys lucidus]